MTGTNATNATINLKIVRYDSKGNIYYNYNTTISYGCTAYEFNLAVSNFDSFYSYNPSIVRNVYSSNGTLIDNIYAAAKIEYVVSFYLLRPLLVQN